MIKFSRPAARPARCHAELRDRLDHVALDRALSAEAAGRRDMIIGIDVSGNDRSVDRATMMPMIIFAKCAGTQLRQRSSR